MKICEASNLIKHCTQRMNASYAKVVFDEWACPFVKNDLSIAGIHPLSAMLNQIGCFANFHEKVRLLPLESKSHATPPAQSKANWRPLGSLKLLAPNPSSRSGRETNFSRPSRKQ